MEPLTAEHQEAYPRIRPVEASHIGDMIRIADETKLNHWTAQNYLDEMKIPASIMLRLESQTNNTIGFIVGRIIQGGVAETAVDAEVYNLAVVANEQKKGFGQQLFDAFSAICREKHVANIWLEVRKSNHKANSFYERNGFACVQTRNNFYENPREPALLMKLKLK